jgi:hypothetical protein
MYPRLKKRLYPRRLVMLDANSSGDSEGGQGEVWRSAVRKLII